MKYRPRKPETPGKSIANSKADKDQKIAKLSENQLENTSENSRSVEISENLGHLGPNKPPEKLPNPRENSSTVSGKPVKFSNLDSFLGISNRLVGHSNFYKVEKPSVGNEAGQRKMRYCLKKKEEVLAKVSNNPISKYFLKKKDLEICIYGKRKANYEESNESKKPRVGNMSTDK